MAIPNPKELYCPILKYLAESSSDRSFKKIKDEMANEFNLSDAEKNERYAVSGKNRLENIILWALRHLEVAGLQERPSKGKYRITAKGENLRADDNKIIEVVTLAVKEEQEKLKEKRKGDKEDSPGTQEQQPTYPANIADEKTPEDRIEEAYKQHKDRLIGEVLDTIMRMDDGDFERLAALLLEKMGYGESEERIKTSRDGGIDGIINQDALGLERVYIQAKRWKDTSPVGSDRIHSFAGALDDHGATKGVFVTTSIFSGPAKKVAESISKKKALRLIDGEELAELMIKYKVGVVTEYTYEIKKLDENFFADEQ